MAVSYISSWVLDESSGENPGKFSGILGEAKPGGFQTEVFPTFFGKGPDCVADPFGTVSRRRCE